MVPLALLIALGAGTAHAQTAAGTLITNVATATRYLSNLGVEYSASYNSTIIVLVAQPEVQLYKNSSPSMACSGGTVTFCILAVNSSPFTTAFNVIIEDPMPADFAYVKGAQQLWSASGSAIMGWARKWPTGSCCEYLWNDDPPDGQTTTTGSIWLKWALSELGPNNSAMVCFQMRLL